MTEDHDGVNIWLAYSDLFAGMLIVFGFFYGMELEHERATKKELQKAQNKAVVLLEKVANNINAKYKGTNKEVKSDGMQLVLPADTTFVSGSYNVRSESKVWLLEIATEIRKTLETELGIDRRSVTIEIHGQTDAWQVKAGQYCIPTNWELSSRRATEIVRLFQDSGALDPAQYNIVAIGAAEYKDYENNFKDYTHRILKKPEELETLRKIEIRILPNYGGILKSLSTQQLENSQALPLKNHP